MYIKFNTILKLNVKANIYMYIKSKMTLSIKM